VFIGTLAVLHVIIECGDTRLQRRVQRLLLRAIAIGRRRDELKDSTLRQYLTAASGQTGRGAVPR
jgi:hypothetical protein